VTSPSSTPTPVPLQWVDREVKREEVEVLVGVGLLAAAAGVAKAELVVEAGPPAPQAEAAPLAPLGLRATEELRAMVGVVAAVTLVEPVTSTLPAS
jgi:hypothetical protein